MRWTVGINQELPWLVDGVVYKQLLLVFSVEIVAPLFMLFLMVLTAFSILLAKRLRRLVVGVLATRNFVAVVFVAAVGPGAPAWLHVVFRLNKL